MYNNVKKNTKNEIWQLYYDSNEGFNYGNLNWFLVASPYWWEMGLQSTRHDTWWDTTLNKIEKKKKKRRKRDTVKEQGQIVWEHSLGIIDRSHDINTIIEALFFLVFLRRATTVCECGCSWFIPKTEKDKNKLSSCCLISFLVDESRKWCQL